MFGTKKMIRLLSFILIFFVGYFCLTGPASAMKVSPGAFCAQNVKIGQETDTGIDLTIDNETDKEREFSVRVVSPRTLKSESLKGYSNLPITGWLRLEKTTMVAPAKGQVKSRMYIKIPNEEQYYNQQWAVSCLIEYVGQKGLFQEAIMTLFMFETMPKKDVTEKPFGNLAVVPSVVKVTGSAMKAKEEFSFKLYNNTADEHTYTIKTFVPKEEKGKLEINVTSGLAWAKNTSWISPRVRKIKVAPGTFAEIKLNVTVPASELAGDKGVEALVFADSDTGERKFVRVQVE